MDWILNNMYITAEHAAHTDRASCKTCMFSEKDWTRQIIMLQIKLFSSCCKGSTRSGAITGSQIRQLLYMLQTKMYIGPSMPCSAVKWELSPQRNW